MKKIILAIFLIFCSLGFSAPTPEKAFDEMMQNLKNKNFYYEMGIIEELNDFSGETQDAFLNFLIKENTKTSYQIINNKKFNNKKAVLKVKVKSPVIKDYAPEILGEVVKRVYKNYKDLSEDRAMGIVLEEINKILDREDLKYGDQTLNFQVVKKGNDWSVDTDDDETSDSIISMITGDISEILDDM